MGKASYKDSASFFQEVDFPGRRMISWSIGAFLVVYFLPKLVATPWDIPPAADYVRSVVDFFIVTFYFVGFWMAIVGKGYPKVVFLISFVPFIGVLVLFYLPQRAEITDSK